MVKHLITVVLIAWAIFLSYLGYIYPGEAAGLLVAGGLTGVSLGVWIGTNYT